MKIIRIFLKFLKSFFKELKESWWRILAVAGFIVLCMYLLYLFEQSLIK